MSRLLNRLQEHRKKKARNDPSLSSEYERYVNSDFVTLLDNSEFAAFDLLGFWKAKESMFPVLSRMTMDIISVQATSVASESAFSTSGRVLSIRRTRLTPASLEMCMCLKDHLDAQERKQHKSGLENPIDFEEEILDAEVQQNEAIPLSEEEIALDVASSEGTMSGSGSGGEEKDAVTLLKRIRKFSVTQDIEACADVHIFNRIICAIAKKVGAQSVSRGIYGMDDDYVSALDCLRGTIPSFDFSFFTNKDTAPSKAQQTLASALFSKMVKDMEVHFDMTVRQKAVFECLRAQHAQDFLLAISIDGLGQHMSLVEYRIILKSFGEHAIHCKELSSFKYRHDMVRDVIFDICRRAGIYTKKEAPVNFLTGPLMEDPHLD
ncbi:zinc finger BED domain-containing protein RICESLEEPER 2 [Tanacetum coccineum]